MIRTEKVTKITSEHYEGSVYNIEVEPTHPIYDDQYYVCADNGIVIHNCHPRDNIALRWLSQNLELDYDLFHAIMHSRDKQAENKAKFLYKLQLEHKLKIVIHGRAYKPYVEYTDGSYSELVGHFLTEMNADYEYVDPLTNDIRSDNKPAIYLMAHNPAVTYSGTGVNVTIDSYYCSIASGSVIVDPWRVIKETDDITVIHYGNTRNR